VKLSPKQRTDRFFSNSVFIFLTRFFPVLAALLIQMYYSRQLSQSAYGSYQNFWVQLTIFAAIACAGVHIFIVTYPPDLLIRLIFKGQRKYFLYFFSWLFITCIAFAWFQNGNDYGYILPFVFLFTHAVSAIGESFLIVFKRTKYIAWVNVIYASAFVGLHYVAFQSHIALGELFLYILALMLLRLAVYVLLSNFYIQANKQAALASELIATGIGKLWLHMGLYDFLNVLSRWVDKFVVSLLLAESISGIYFNGAVDIPFIPLIVGAAGSATLIQLANKKDKSEPAYTIALAHRSSRLLATIIFPLFFFFVLYRYEIFDLVFTSKFEEAVPIFLASCFMIPLRAYTFTTVLQNRNKGNIINAGAVLDLVLALSLVYPLYQAFGLAGIALSFTLATYVQAAFYLIYTSKLLQVSVLRLIPYRYWITLLIIFACSFIGIHYVSSAYLTSAISLTLGVIFTAVVILVTLLRELKSQRTEYVDTQA
jgi:O-antigen/teichoic acid export membrane protein